MRKVSRALLKYFEAEAFQSRKTKGFDFFSYAKANPQPPPSLTRFKPHVRLTGKFFNLFKNEEEKKMWTERFSLRSRETGDDVPVWKTGEGGAGGSKTSG